MGLRTREGHWHYRFEIDGHEWTGNTGLAATERNRKAALRVELEARQMIEQGKSHLLHIQAVPFSDGAAKFIDWCQAAHRDKPNTWRRTRGSLSSLIVFFGRTPVSTITQGDIADYIAWRATEHKVKDVTIRHDLHNLSKFFQYAVKHNWRRDNPVVAEDIPSDENAVRMHIFDASEEMRYLQAAERYPKLHDLAVLMLELGCRPEELLSAEVVHVDLRARKIRIDNSKTKAGKRSIRIRPRALEILTRLVRSARGPYLFASERYDTRSLSLSTVENWHVKVREATKIPCVIYDWRHTFATRAANGGMSLATLAKVLGHNGLRSLMKYVHPDQKEQDRAMDELSFQKGQPDENRTKSENPDRLQ